MVNLFLFKMFPQNPKSSSISITSISPTLASLTHSLKRQVRRRGGQRWLIDVKYPPLSREEFAPIWAFSIAQQGQFKTFEYIPEIYGSTSGEATGSIIVDEAFKAGDSIISTTGLTGTLKAGDFIKFGHDKVYILTADGSTTLNIEPALIADIGVPSIDADAGDFAYHAEFGWTRSQTSIILDTYNGLPVFIVSDNDGLLYTISAPWTFQKIQNLHIYGGFFGGRIALDINNGNLGSYSILETLQAGNILESDGITSAFPGQSALRILVRFQHNETHLNIGSIVFDGVSIVSPINFDGNVENNTVPEIAPGEFFDYKLYVKNGLNQRLYLFVNDVLVSNPTFTYTGTSEGLSYGSGSSSGVDRISYVRNFGMTIDEPITYHNVPFKMAFTGDITNMSVAVNQYVSYSLKLVEIV